MLYTLVLLLPIYHTGVSQSDYLCYLYLSHLALHIKKTNSEKEKKQKTAISAHIF